MTGGPVVDAIWRRLLDRSGPRPGQLLTEDPGLHLLVDGKPIYAMTQDKDVYVFVLPCRPESVRIVSWSSVPSELGLARDPRALGVGIRRIAVRQGTKFQVTRINDAALAEGFHAFEPANGLRWTDGDAALPPSVFGQLRGQMELVLQIGAKTKYPEIGGSATAPVVP